MVPLLVPRPEKKGSKHSRSVETKHERTRFRESLHYLHSGCAVRWRIYVVIAHSLNALQKSRKEGRKEGRNCNAVLLRQPAPEGAIISTKTLSYSELPGPQSEAPNSLLRGRPSNSFRHSTTFISPDLAFVQNAKQKDEIGKRKFYLQSSRQFGI